MSHAKERAEKICLNCGTELQGFYCHRCGQENREPRDTVWGLISHFFYDITHFDGKFFSTLRHLIRRPGFLSREYIAGRRASYLNPIRMYVFTSAVFFIVFFTLFNFHDVEFSSAGKSGRENKYSIEEARKNALAHAESGEDSVIIEKTFQRIYRQGAADSTKNAPEKREKTSVSWGGTEKYQTVAEYDSAQKALPAAQRDGWMTTLISRRVIQLRAEYKGDQNRFLHDLFEKFMHSFPSLLFVSLPLYALFLQILYFRRKQFYYVDHGIFLIHLYVFTFLFLLLYFAIYKLDDLYPSGWWNWIEVLLMLYGIYYAFRAMHKFYGQGAGRTLLKFALLNIMAFVSLMLLFSVFFVITVYRL